MLEDIQNPQADGWDALAKAVNFAPPASGFDPAIDFNAASFEQPIENVQTVNQVLTTLVLGTPQIRQMPGEEILPPITVSNWKFEWNSFGTEHMREYDAERGMRAQIGHSDFKTSSTTDKLKRFSWKILRDVDELANDTQGLRTRVRAASMARDIVELAMEIKRAELLIDPTSYGAGNTVTIAGGDEWDSGGDSRDDIQTVANAIADDLAVIPEEITVWLSIPAYRAALQDTAYRTFKTNHFRATGASGDIVPLRMADELNALAQYWGVGRVWTSNIRKANPDGTVTSVYGDVAILYYRTENSVQPWDTTYGEYSFGHDFRWSQGVAAAPFYIEDRTTWAFPWHAYSKPRITNPSAGGLILNCAA